MIELDRFRLIELIGDGSMGEVYKAHQVSMDRTVAVKVLPADLARDELFKTRFMHEARAIGKLNHPNIVQGIDFGDCGEHLYFVMEYVDGQTLYKILKQGPLEEDEVLEIGLLVARALEHGHGQGIVHRDIKPGNIMITTEGNVKVTDYGLAKRAEGTEVESVTEGEVVGTPYYISPEQAMGEEDIDIRSDIYSLGATLYHVATGEPPFQGENAQVIINKATEEPFPDMRKVRPELSGAFAKLVLRMTQKDRNRRPANPSDLVREIERVKHASADERHLKKIGANLRRTFRRVVVGDEGGSAVSPKVRLAIAGVIAAAAIAVVLVILLSGMEQPGQPSAPVALTPSEEKQAEETIVERGVKPETPSTGKPGVERKVPDARPAVKPKPEKKTAEAKEELAQAAQKAYLAAEEFAKSTKDVEQAIARLEAVSTTHEGPFAQKAGKFAQELRSRWEKEGEEELKRRKRTAKQAVTSGNFGAAVRAYANFPARLLKTAAGAEAHRLTLETLDRAIARYQGHRVRAEKLAASGRYDEAIEEYEKTLRFGIKRVTNQAKAQIAAVEKKKAQAQARASEEEARRLKQLLNGFYSQYAPLIESKDFKGALRLCQSVLADKSKEQIHDRVKLEKADAEMVLKVKDAAREGALALKLQQYQLELEGGATVKGLVREVDGETILVQLADMRGAVRGVKMSRLSGRAFVKLAMFKLGDKPEHRLACGVYLLLARDEVAQARKEFELARQGGLDVSRYLTRLETFKKQQEEQEAKALLEQLRDLLKRKKWQRATLTADKLTRDYKDTELVKSLRHQIEKAHTDAMMQLAAEEQAAEKQPRPRKGKGKRLPGLVGTYFNGRNFDSQRARRIDAKIDFNWRDKKPHPDVRKDNFSIRWEGIIAIPRSGRYTFIVNSDDGCRMWLGGQKLFDAWRGRTAQDSSKELTLKKGYYPIKIEYYDAGGAASIKFSWSIGGRGQVIPAKYLYRSK